MMSTRSGDLDPDVLVYLMDHRGYKPRDIDRLVTQKASLIGVSGLSGDMQTQLSVQGENPQAALSIAMFCASVLQRIGAFVAVLGGMNRLVSTAGIAERALSIRSDICHGLNHLAIVMEEPTNGKNSRRISNAQSMCAVEVVSTNEVLMIARHCAACFASGMSNP